MKYKNFHLFDHKLKGRYDAKSALREEVCTFCEGKDVVSITGDPSVLINIDMTTSDDKKGYNYQGEYTVWYRENI